MINSSSSSSSPLRSAAKEAIRLVVLLGVVWLLLDRREENSIDAALIRDTTGLKRFNSSSSLRPTKTSWHKAKSIEFIDPADIKSPPEIDDINDGPNTEAAEETNQGLEDNSNNEGQPNVSGMEHVTVPDDGEGFFVDTDNMCKELLTRSNGTKEGEEPWRETGLLYITQDCAEHGKAMLGSHLSRWYIMRIIAAAAGVTLQSAACNSPVTDRIQHDRIFSPSDTVVDNGEQFSWRKICQSCVGDGDEACRYAHGEPHGDLPHAASIIRSDLQGLTNDIIAESPDIEMDEVAIHLRCGNMAREDYPLYGLVPYHVYSKYIPAETKTIGLVTASFKGRYTAGDATLDEAIVMGARDFLQNAFPEATVSVRYDAMDVAYARQVAASTLICGPSTFCLYPAIATMGQSYTLHSPLFGDSPNWIDELEQQDPDRIHYVGDPYISSGEIFNLDVNEVLDMLKKDPEGSDSSSNSEDETDESEIEGSEDGDSSSNSKDETDESDIEVSEDGDESPETFVPGMEQFSIENVEGFFEDTVSMCRELLARSEGTTEGEEPWRESGLLFLPHDCEEQGTSVLGNHLSRWYLLRIIAAAAGVTIRSTCSSPVTDRIQDGRIFFPNETVVDNRDQFSWRKICDTCANDGDGPCRWGHGEPHGDLGHAATIIRSDLQDMTNDVMTESPDTEMDEVVVHLRCGDVLIQDHPLYGIVPYHVYTKYIPKETKTIGIVTAPFKQDRIAWGYGDADLNEAVVMGALEYLRQSFPQAKVSVRNDANERMDVVYARQVAASTLVCGPSTFCLYPAIATMGQSFILHSPLFGDSPNWIDDLEQQDPDRIHYVDDSYIPSTEIFELKVAEIVAMIKADPESENSANNEDAVQEVDASPKTDDSPNIEDEVQEVDASPDTDDKAQKTDGAVVEGSNGGDEPPETFVSEMENFTTPFDEGPGFIVDPTNMCIELIARSKGTEEGNEPWREKGLLYIPNDCEEQGSSVLGNHLSRWYILRIITAAAGVTLRSTCKSPVTSRIQDSIIFSPGDTVIDNSDQFSWRKICDTCANIGDGPCKYAHGEKHGDLSHATTIIRSDLQGMANDIMAEAPDTEMDEVVIHLRCGDILRQKHALYGIVPYHVYAKYIPEDTKTIGIVTAPFKQDRWGWGYGDSDLNEAVVMGAREYLQDTFPHAKVSIRNNANEPMDVAYARQVAATTLICGPSTFCLYPAIATMGQSYILHSPLFGDSPNWIDEIEKQDPDHIHYVNDSYIPSTEIFNLNVTDIVAMIKIDSDAD